jgi:membrane-associated phospholipid phosphatase
MNPARRAMWACGALAAAFVVEGAMVAMGLTRVADQQVAAGFARIWNPHLHVLFQAIAVLGGPEVTGALALGLFFYLRRTGFRTESWAVLALPVASLVEVLYKRTVFQPGPGVYSHADGPSLSALIVGAGGAANSFPSGHMVRTVLMYGLVGFVIYRLAPWRRAQRLAVPVAVIIVAAMTLDRLYLGVHWQSDVVGGLLLGGLALAAAITWLEQPWKSPGR